MRVRPITTPPTPPSTTGRELLTFAQHVYALLPAIEAQGPYDIFEDLSEVPKAAQARLDARSRRDDLEHGRYALRSFVDAVSHLPDRVHLEASRWVDLLDDLWGGINVLLEHQSLDPGQFQTIKALTEAVRPVSTDLERRLRFVVTGNRTMASQFEALTPWGPARFPELMRWLGEREKQERQSSPKIARPGFTPKTLVLPEKLFKDRPRRFVRGLRDRAQDSFQILGNPKGRIHLPKAMERVADLEVILEKGPLADLIRHLNSADRAASLPQWDVPFVP